MNISIAAASLQDRPTIENLMQFYLYDFSEIDQEDLEETGRFSDYEYLPLYWTELGRNPFLIRVDGKLAGFVLVSQYSLLEPDYRGHSIAEFFILRKYRRCGVGEFAATRTFYRFPGEWQVAQIAANTNAQAFWRKVINRYTGGRYRELTLDDQRWKGTIQIFDNNHFISNRGE